MSDAYSPTGHPDLDPAAAAIALAGRGFAVFPLRPDGKVPAVRKDWEGRATSDPRRIRQLFRAARANIGIACGPSNLVVIDLDTAKSAASGARHGADTLRALAAGRDLPATFTVTTPSGGKHLYYRPPEGSALRNTAGRLGPLIDTRAAGGYVVAPGSIINGAPYTITGDVPIAPLPGWLLNELLAPRQSAAVTATNTIRPARIGESAAAYAAAALQGETDRVRAAQPGTRNDTLNRAAYSLGRLVGAGHLDRDLAASELQHAAQHTGLSPREAAATVKSGLTAGTRSPRRIPSPDNRAAAPPSRFGTSRPPSLLPTSAPTQRGVGGAAITDRRVWARILARHTALQDPIHTLRHELAVSQATADFRTRRSAPEITDDQQPLGISADNPRPVVEIINALRTVDDAYDTAALSAAPLAHTPEWRRIRTITDALRDLRDEIQHGAPDYARSLRDDAGFHLALRTLAADACLRLSQLTVEIADRRSRRGRPDSPVRTALGTLHRAVEIAAAELRTFPRENNAPSPRERAMRTRRV
jgi:hypothetical protein